MQSARVALWAFVAVTCAAATVSAADVVVKGTVTDDAGKPIRGAEVRASKDDKGITRFSQSDGRFQLTLPSGSYDITAEAFGFAAKAKKLTVDASRPTEANFSLSPRWDVAHLSGAEIDRLMPADQPGANLLRRTCTGCHDFDVIRHRAGQTAAEWKAFLPGMTRGRRTQPNFSPDQLEALSQALELNFGPNSPYLGPDADPPTPQQVNHPELKDAALKATIYEWTIPTGPDAFPHSIEAGNADNAFFAEVGLRAMKFGSFDLATEKFQEWPAPAVPHTGAVGKDGRVWEALQGGPQGGGARKGNVPDLTVLDPKTGAMKSFTFQGQDKATAHTPIVDHNGNVWLSVGAGAGPTPTSPASAQVWFFDTEKEQFKAYIIPVPKNSGTYHVGEDSKGMIWASLSGMGALARINPQTGETKVFSGPNIQSIRGMVVDSHDNVWFAAFLDHKLGKLDPSTGSIKLYQPPTLGAAPYGIVEDKKTGYIWYADFSASQVTRFNPKTEQFVEYPLPLHPSIPRFIDVDNKGRIWFTEYWNGKIGYVDTGDAVRESVSR